jgi:antitoxin YefM
MIGKQPLHLPEWASRISTYLRTYMTTISYSDFRRNLAKFLNSVEEDCEEIVIHRSKGRSTVVLSLDEYLSLKETAYLLSTPRNRKHLEKSLKEASEDDAVTIAL